MPTIDLTRDRQTVMVPLNKLTEWSTNVRSDYDEAELEELTNSILEHGLLQPITVVGGPDIEGNDGTYGVHIGHRRYRALELLRKQKKIKASEPVPCIVDNGNLAAGEMSSAGLARQLIENLQRTDLSILDEARGYARMVEDHGYTQRDLAATVGRSPGHVTKRLALLALPKEVLPFIGGRITVEQAYELSQLDDDQIKKLTKNIVGGGRGNFLQYDLPNAKATQAKRRKSEKFKKALEKMMIEPLKELPADVDKDLFENLGWFDEEKLKKHTMRKNHVVVAGAAPMTEVYIYRQMTPKQLETARAKEAERQAEIEAKRQAVIEEQEQEYAEYIETEANPHEQWEYAIDLERERYNDELAAYNEAIGASLGGMLLDQPPKEIGKLALALVAQSMFQTRHVQRACNVLGLDVPHEDAEGKPLMSYDRPYRAVLLDWIGNDTTRAITAWVATHADAEDVRNLDVFATFRSQLDDQGVTPPAPLDLDQFGPEPWYDEATDTWHTEPIEVRALADGTTEPQEEDFEDAEEFAAATQVFNEAWEIEQADTRAHAA